MSSKLKATTNRRCKQHPLALALRRVFDSGARFGWGALAALPSLALAGPSGEHIIAGDASVVRPDARTTRIDQSSQNAVVNWNEFSVGSDEYVIFNQPGATAAILNRVVGSDPSAILGQVSANGRVFLVNPRGVYFAPGARVDVAALAASALDIGDDDFMAGRYVFTKPEGAPEGAMVRNDGTIEAGPEGFVVLAGDYVNNNGVIAGQLGTVVLASGSQVTLQLGDDGLINFAVDTEVLSGLAGVENLGTIAADGGRVLMTAKVAEGLVATAVNNSGLVRAQRIVEENGEVFLRARGGDIAQSGTIDVSGVAGVNGGRVIITGDQDIVVAADSTIAANGGADAAGGTVRVIANGTLEFRRDAKISVLAGGTGDSGGMIELSGHKQLVLDGDATLGAGGELVIDPAELYFTAGSGVASSSYGAISNIGVDLVEAHLNDGTNVTLFANDKIGVSGAGLELNAVGSGDLSLRIGSIDYGSSGSLTGSYCYVGLCEDGTSIEFTEGSSGEIDLSAMNISIGGDLEIRAGTYNGTIKTANLAAGGFALISAGASASTEGHASIETGQITSGVDLTINAGNLNTDPTIVKTGNLVAGRDVAVNAVGPGAKVTVNDVTAADDMGIYAMSGDVTAHKLVATGLATGETNFTITVRGLTTSGSIAVTNDVIASGTNTQIDFSAKNIHISGETRATAGNDALVKLYGNVTVGKVDADGPIKVDAGHSGDVWLRGRYVDLGGGVAINANTGDASLSVPTSVSEVDITGNVSVKSTTKAAWIEIGGSDVTVVGDMLASAGSEVWLSMWTEEGTAPGNLTINGKATAIGDYGGIYLYGSAGNVNVSGALLAQAANSVEVELWSANDIVVGGAVTASGDSANVSGWAPGDIDITGQVRALADGEGDIEFRGHSVTLRGGVLASASIYSAEINLSASYGGGLVNITGDVKAKSLHDDGRISINGATVNVAGSLFAEGSDSASIDLGDDSDIDSAVITGGITVRGDGDEASFEFEGRTLSVGGAIVVDGSSYADAEIYAIDEVSLKNVSVTGDYADLEIAAGKITVNGNLVVDGGSAAIQLRAGDETSYSASVYTEAIVSSNDVQVSGSITVKGVDGSAYALLSGEGIVIGGATLASGDATGFIGLDASGNVSVQALTAAGADASIYAIGRNITLNGAVQADSIELLADETLVMNALVRGIDVLGAAGTSIKTLASGVVEGSDIFLGLDATAGGTIDVRTKTGVATFYGYGVVDLKVDNTAYTGTATFGFSGDGVSGNFSAMNLRSGGSLMVKDFQTKSLQVEVPGIFTALGAVKVVGGGALPIQETDTYLFERMTEAGLLPPAHGPDLLIRATQGIDFDSTLAFDHLTPYLKLFSNGATTMPSSVIGVAGAEFTVVYSPIDPSLPVLFEATPFAVPVGSVGYNAVNHFASIPGTTIAFGEGTSAGGMILTGPITIGTSGLIDLGNDNFMLLTGGPVVGLGNVISTGRIVQVGRSAYSPLEVPVMDEFSEDDEGEGTDDDDELIEDLTDEDGVGDDNIVEESNVGQLECSA